MSDKKSVNIPGIGSKFPSFSANTTDGEMSLPDCFKDKWFVFFSHPADFTPVCTSEFLAFGRSYDEFAKFNCELIGYSGDGLQEHKKWQEAMEGKYNVELPFPIIADPESKTADKLGLFHPCNDDKVLRATFVVDDQATIRLISFYPPELGRSQVELIRVIEALQISDKHEVTLPADWPNNREVGGQVMVDPEQAKAGKKFNKQLHGDWWFCHRKL